jgi:hypothetical protein
MMGKKAGLVLALMMGVTAFSVANDESAFGDGPYLGQRPPGVTAEVFAPGLIPEGE